MFRRVFKTLHEVLAPNASRGPIFTIHAMRSCPKNDTRKYRLDARPAWNVCLLATFYPFLTRCPWLGRRGAKVRNAMTERWIFPSALLIGLALGLSACTNPYDPVQRTIGGGLIGAGSGAAIGAAAAGGHGAALGAAVGGAVGAVGGLITTPPPPRYRY